MGDAVDRPEQGLARRHWYADERFRFMGDGALSVLAVAVADELRERRRHFREWSEARRAEAVRGSEDDGA